MGNQMSECALNALLFCVNFFAGRMAGFQAKIDSRADTSPMPAVGAVRIGWPFLQGSCDTLV